MSLLPFIEDIKDRDPKFFEIMKSLQELAYAPSALDPKTKLLICLAVDATVGARGGVESLAKTLKAMGTTDDEISDCLRLTYFAKANSILEISTLAFKE